MTAAIQNNLPEPLRRRLQWYEKVRHKIEVAFEVSTERAEELLDKGSEYNVTSEHELIALIAEDLLTVQEKQKLTPRGL